MNYKIATDILDIKNKDFTKKELKRSYYKKCLQYHPDKNNQHKDGIMFKKCNEAYIYLLQHIDFDKTTSNIDNNNIYSHHDDEKNMSYKEYIKQYISLISEKYNWDHNMIYNSLDVLLKDAKKMSFKIFESMKKDTIIEIYEYMLKYKDLFKIDKESLDKLRDIIKSKHNKIKVFNLTPKLGELMQDMVFVLEYNNKKKYIPLWHNELHFNDCIVYIYPELPNNIEIDDDNNINITINMTEKEMFNGENKKITICENKDIYIDTNNLYCRKFQKYYVKNKGIAKIDEHDMFNIKNRGDIIVNINTV